MKAHRLGYWSSAAVATIGVAYIVALAAGFARHGFREPITDPVLAIMEILTLLSAPALLLVMASIHDVAPPDRKIYGLIAVAFATLFTGITCAVHFLELSAGRQLGNASIVWPSRSYAAELLAWDVFLGFALLAAAASLHMTDVERSLSRLASVCGGLCVIGIVGPIVGNMRLQLIGVFGYAVLLPILALLLMRAFGKGPIRTGA